VIWSMLPELSVRMAKQGDVLPPSQAEGGVRSWSVNPAVTLFGYSGRSYDWVHVPEWVTFRFRPGELCVGAFAQAERDSSDVRDLYERSVLPLVLQAAGRQVIHAAAVSNGETVVALAGTSTAGKSTLAAALAHRGFSLWADDAVAFSLDRNDSVLSTPLPFSLRLRPGPVTAQGARPAQRSNDARLTRIVLLRPDEAFPAVLPHAYCFSLDDTERNREMVRDYLLLVERVPVWTFRFRRRPEELPRISSALERFVSSPE